jgi:hypothetical protein
MKALRQFGALVVLLVWAFIPMMACAMPAAQMTASERACCQQMKMSCGDMGMPSSHECCHKDVQADHTVAVHAKVTVVQPDLASVSQLSSLLPMLTSQQAFLPESLDTSPPQPPPAAINILRI